MTQVSSLVVHSTNLVITFFCKWTACKNSSLKVCFLHFICCLLTDSSNSASYKHNYLFLSLFDINVSRCFPTRHLKSENIHCCGVKAYNIKDPQMKCCAGTLYNLTSLDEHGGDAQCCGSILQKPQVESMILMASTKYFVFPTTASPPLNRLLPVVGTKHDLKLLLATVVSITDANF